MSVTIDLKMLLLIIVCIAVVVLVIYVVRFLKSLMVTLEHTNEVLKDVEVITDGIISDVADTVSDITETINGKQNIISTAAAIAKAVISVKNTAEKDK